MVIPWLLLLEMGLYASSFVCGIVTASSLTIVQGSFGGLCMLYGTVTHNSSSDSILVQTSSSPSLCYFVSAISVCVCSWARCVCVCVFLGSVCVCSWARCVCVCSWARCVCVCVCVPGLGVYEDP
ncbi:Transmembrane protein 179B precursor [Salmo salar]|uniref:Transmembrane protein 179B n=1 Tax=Salmo salar TaxID=8030 RepID=B9EMN7_SALSA|nr:Transmembrane protein 179B precursor [Salmo salar]ACM08784.1 Transmembrane protein 179B [Salmo salar]|eukprot:NP_001139939.1 Transmembrane protein 179B precursor [Salmo salar]